MTHVKLLKVVVIEISMSLTGVITSRKHCYITFNAPSPTKALCLGMYGVHFQSFQG